MVRIIPHLYRSICRRQLRNLLESIQKFYSNQFCSNASLTSFSANILLKQANFGRVDIAVFEFSKAFDTVTHNRLLTKLKHYGIAGNTLTWIREFLTNRTQRVLVEGHGSQLVSVRSGVHQGTRVGSLQFEVHFYFGLL